LEAGYPGSQAYKVLTLRKDFWNINPGGSLDGALPRHELYVQLPPLVDTHVELLDHPPLRLDEPRPGFFYETAPALRNLRLVRRGDLGRGRSVDLHGHRRGSYPALADGVTKPRRRQHRVSTVRRVGLIGEREGLSRERRAGRHDHERAGGARPEDEHRARRVRHTLQPQGWRGPDGPDRRRQLSGRRAGHADQQPRDTRDPQELHNLRTIAERRRCSNLI